MQALRSFPFRHCCRGAGNLNSASALCRFLQELREQHADEQTVVSRIENQVVQTRSCHRSLLLCMLNYQSTVARRQELRDRNAIEVSHDVSPCFNQSLPNVESEESIGFLETRQICMNPMDSSEQPKVSCHDCSPLARPARCMSCRSKFFYMRSWRAGSTKFLGFCRFAKHLVFMLRFIAGS